MSESVRRGLYYLGPGVMLVGVGVGFGIEFATECVEQCASISGGTMSALDAAADMPHVLDFKLAVLAIVCLAGWTLVAMGATRLMGNARSCRKAITAGAVLFFLILVDIVLAFFDVEWAREALLRMGCPLVGQPLWPLYFLPMVSGLALGYGFPSE